MMIRAVTLFSLMLTVGCASIIKEAAESRPALKSAPLWTIGSLVEEPHVDSANLQLLPGTKKREASVGKPKGPIIVTYLLEHWAQGDHRLIIEVEARAAIEKWIVSVRGGAEVGNRLIKTKELRISKPTYESRAFRERRYYQLGGLTGLDRLLVTVEGVLNEQSISETVSVALVKSSVAPRICGQGDKSCLQLLPAVITF
jgi:hypothetical protein